MLEEQLQEVLDWAHAGHRYIADEVQYHKPEHWTIGLVGDCEDFALAVRQKLKSKGIESDLIFCIVENGGGHLVCSVDGWILDNRHKWVMRRDDLDYEWISISQLQPDGTYIWFEIKG